MNYGAYAEHYILLSGILFAIGAVGFLVRRNVIVQLMAIELMLNSVNLAFVAFNRIHPASPTGEALMTGQVFTFFVIAVAAAEAAVGLAIVLSFYRLRQTVNSDAGDLLKH